MKKVLLLSDKDNVVGGGEISLAILASHLNRSRYHPIVGLIGIGEFYDRLNRVKVDCLFIDQPKILSIRLDHIVLSIWRLYKNLKLHHIHLIHANSTRSMFYAGLAAKIANIPCIWHLRIAKKTDFLLDRILFILSKRVIAISSAVRERLSWSRKQWKIKTIPNGVDIELFHPNNKKFRQEICMELNINPHKPIICTVSQIHPQKHLEIFIKAASHILLSVPEAQFIICGREVSESVGHQKELEILAEDLGIKDTIHFVGFYSDIHKILGASDLFILSSLGEAFGRVIIEAMATKLPVIATRSGGIPDIITHRQTGFLFSPLDYPTLAKLAIDILNNSDLSQNISNEARKAVINNFSINIHAERIQNLYEEIIKGI